MRFLAAEGIFRQRAEFFLFGVEAPAAEDDAQAGHDGDGEVDAEDAGDFASGHYTENCRQGVQFHALAHDARRRNVVLEQAPDPEKNDQNQPVFVAHQQRDANDDHGGGQRPDDGNEFQHSAENAQNQRVGNAHHAQYRGIHDEGQSGQGELSANEVGQHLVEIVEHVFEKLALRAGLDGREQEVAEVTAILQKKDRQQRHNKEKPGLLGDVCDTQSDALGELSDLVAVADQK